MSDRPRGDWTDERLFDAYVGGDRAAFRELFERYAGLLARVMQRGVPGAHAQDLVQQTFLQVHRARHDFEVAGGCGPGC